MFRSSTADIFVNLGDILPQDESNNFDFTIGFGDSFYDADGKFNRDLVMAEETSKLQQEVPELLAAANQSFDFELANFDNSDFALNGFNNPLLVENNTETDGMPVEQQSVLLQNPSVDQKPSAIKPAVRHRRRNASYRDLLDDVDSVTGEKITAAQVREGRDVVRFKTFLQRNYRFADDDKALSRNQIREMQYANGTYFFGKREVVRKSIYERDTKRSSRRAAPHHNVMIQPDADFTPTFASFKK
jgi:hypothetical protein